MRLRQIEVFHAIYTTGSISAAARKLHVTQPAVSKVLHHTQAQLGMTLFELVRGRLVATEQAHALYREVGEIHERLAALDKAVGNLRQLAGGLLRVACVPSLGQHVLPAAVTALRRQHPQLSVDVQTVHHDEVLRRLLERDCELALVYAPASQPRLRIQPLVQAELMVLAQTGEFAAGQPVQLAQLQGRPMVGLTSSGPLGDLFDAAIDRAGVALGTAVTSQTYAIGAALTAHGAGPCVVDEFTARGHRNAHLQAHPLQPALPFLVCCVHLEDRPLSAAAQRFLACFSQAVEALRQRDAPPSG
ncbi:MAG: LysR family transcriptional regulator, partial [Stenotrophomonas sp.]